MASCANDNFSMEVSTIPECYCFSFYRLYPGSSEIFGALGRGKINQPFIMKYPIQHHSFEWISQWPPGRGHYVHFCCPSGYCFLRGLQEIINVWDIGA